MRHEKVDGKYKCHICQKLYGHTRELKKHLQKIHNEKFEMYNEETGEILPQKRKAREMVATLEKRIQKEVKTW